MTPVIAAILGIAALTGWWLLAKLGIEEHDWARIRLAVWCMFWCTLAAAGLALSVSASAARSSLAAAGQHRGGVRRLATGLRNALRPAPRPVMPAKRGKHRSGQLPATRPDTRTAAQRIAEMPSPWLAGERTVRP